MEQKSPVKFIDYRRNHIITASHAPGIALKLNASSKLKPHFVGLDAMIYYMKTMCVVKEMSANKGKIPYVRRESI